MEALCNMCKTFSSMYKKENRCCEIRQIAAMPKEQRQAEYDRVRKEQGEEVAKTFIHEVVQEYQRKKEAWKARNDRPI
jgi:hypothetical protein